MTTSMQDLWEAVPAPRPGTFIIDSAHTHVGFSVRHMMLSKIHGSFKRFEGAIEIGTDPSISSAWFSIHTSSVSTGSEDFDGHLRSPDLLDTETYPVIEFRSKSLEVRSPLELVVGGVLTIKEVSNPIEMTTEITGIVTNTFGQEVLACDIHARIDRREFGLNWNQSLETGGVLASDFISLHVMCQATRS